MSYFGILVLLLCVVFAGTNADRFPSVARCLFLLWFAGTVVIVSLGMLGVIR